MAGDWIPMQVDLDSRREVLILCHLTGWSKFEIIGRLWHFWSWVSRESADGCIRGVSTAVLADVLGVPKKFLEGLVAVGWLVETADGLIVPNYDRWFSNSAKIRLGEQLRWHARRKRYVKSPPNGEHFPKISEHSGGSSGVFSGGSSGKTPEHNKIEENIYTSSSTYICETPEETPEVAPEDPSGQNDAGLRSDFERLAAYWPRGWPRQERDRRLLARLLVAQARGKLWAKSILDSFQEAVQAGPKPRNPGAYLQTLVIRQVPSDELAWFNGLAVPDWVHQDPPRRKPACACSKPPPNGSPPRSPEEIAATRAMLQECIALLIHDPNPTHTPHTA